MRTNRQLRKMRTGYLAVAGAGLTLGLSIGGPLDAATIVNIDTTQTGGSLTINPAGELVVSGPTGPTLTLTNAATSAGVQGIVVGTTQSPIGNSGKLVIQGGSSLVNTGSGAAGLYGGDFVTKGCAYIGFNDNSTGFATVTGGGSSWVNSNEMNVGLFGFGSLMIVNGGSVSNVTGGIGVAAQATGTVLVSGTGSTWVNSSALAVGADGNGTLNIEAGGTVTSPNSFIGLNATASGTASVTGAGSSFKTSDQLHVGYSVLGGVGRLSIGTGGLVQTGNLTSVETATSRLNLAAGGTLKTGGLGLFGDSNRLNWTGGTIEITSLNQNLGTGADLGASLTVGSGKSLRLTSTTNGKLSVASTGTLNISGGNVFVRSLSLATDANFQFTNGTLEVAGGSLSLAQSGGLDAYGSAGQNPTLLLTNGATSSGLFALDLGVRPTNEGFDTGGTGSLRVESGAVLTNSLTFASSATIAVSGVGSKWNAGTVVLGLGGNTLMSVESGGSLETTDLNLGIGIGIGIGSTSGSATMNVTGAGSSLNVHGMLRLDGSSFFLGTNIPALAGDGTLNIRNGAQVSANAIQIGDKGNGTLNVQSGATLSIGSGPFYVGVSSGLGMVNIASGAHFSPNGVDLLIGNGTMNVGGVSFSSGQVAISPIGKLSLSGSTYKSGVINVAGTLDISGGSNVESTTPGITPSVIISSGTAAVRDAGTTWTMNDPLYIGNGGSATLTLSNGAHMTHAGGTISAVALGVGAGSSGSATVTGAGSLWSAVEGGFAIGINGFSTLSVENGGAIVCGGTNVLNGTATIVGAGSTWSCSADFLLMRPNSVVSISNGGALSVGGFMAILEAGVGAKINLGPGGTLTTNTLALQGDPSALNWTGGTLKLTGGAPNFVGPTTTDTGLTIPAGGTLTGIGTIGGSVSNAGVVSPGNSLGLITVNGDISGDGDYLMQIASPTSYDQIHATGTVAFDGSVIAIDLLNDSPTPGDAFDLFDFAGTISGTWSFDFSDAALSPNLTWDTSAFATTGIIRVNAPEPASAALALAVGTTHMIRRRKNRRAVCVESRIRCQSRRSCP
jgi:fibronectin-binding autotransporter adhesin